jgi:ribosomal protein L11 methyltransferase
MGDKYFWKTPMSWIELRLDTTAEAVDWVCTLLAEQILVDDQHNLQINRYTPNDLGDHWAFTVRLYLPAGEFKSVDAIAATLSSLQRTGLATPLQISAVEQPVPAVDYAQRIGQRFVVTGGAGQPSPTADIVLRLKSNLAFGSGLHPATQLSLQLLERHVKPGWQTLDLGSGSGILSVAMAKLGAQVVAIDNDAIAVQATQDAIDRNHVNQQTTVRLGSLGQGSNLGHWMGGALPEVAAIDAPAGFDLIVANIFARIHITLAADYRTALQKSPGARLLIIAGFTQDYAVDVNTALTEVGFAPIDQAHDDEWVALVYRLNS